MGQVVYVGARGGALTLLALASRRQVLTLSLTLSALGKIKNGL